MMWSKQTLLAAIPSMIDRNSDVSMYPFSRSPCSVGRNPCWGWHIGQVRLQKSVGSIWRTPQLRRVGAGSDIFRMIAAEPQHVHLDAAEPGASDALTGVWGRPTIPTRRNRCIGDWSLRWNNGFAALFVALLALPAAGCSQECLTLCNVWFDYQRDMCG